MFHKGVKALFKSGIDRIVVFLKEHKKNIIKYSGKFVIFVCKTIIEIMMYKYLF